MELQFRKFSTLGQAKAEGYEISDAHPCIVWKRENGGWIMAVVIPLRPAT